MIHLFYAYISSNHHEKIISQLLPDFSPEFQENILRYRRWQDAQSSLMGRVLLREGLKKLNMVFKDEHIYFKKNNKPYFDKNGINFNISHSGGLVVCAITSITEIGVDIEKVCDVDLTSFVSQMTRLEWNNISNSKNRLDSFFIYWTQKEAVIKAHGGGLSIPLNSFEVCNNKATIDLDSFFLKELYLGKEYKCHIAVKNIMNNFNMEIINVDPLKFLK